MDFVARNSRTLNVKPTLFLVICQDSRHHACLACMSSVVAVGFHKTVGPGGSTIGRPDDFDGLLCRPDGFGKVERSSVVGSVAEFRRSVYCYSHNFPFVATILKLLWFVPHRTLKHIGEIRYIWRLQEFFVCTRIKNYSVLAHNKTTKFAVKTTPFIWDCLKLIIIWAQYSFKQNPTNAHICKTLDGY
jgi:hypothetical protein